MIDPLIITTQILIAAHVKRVRQLYNTNIRKNGEESIVKTSGFKVYALFHNQINILILRANIAEAIQLITIQRSKPQKQHVQMTSNVVVFMIRIVMVVHGVYIKVLTLPRDKHMDKRTAHGQEVSFDLFFQKNCQIFNN